MIFNFIENLWYYTSCGSKIRSTDAFGNYCNKHDSCQKCGCNKFKDYGKFNGKGRLIVTNSGKNIWLGDEIEIP